MRRKQLRIEATPDGPYGVYGGVDLVRVGYVTDDDGHSVDWAPRAAVDTSDQADDEGTYWLCRCGRSDNKPFCDGSHNDGFDGTEAAPTSTYDERAKVMQGAGVQVRDDRGICEHAGFCTRAHTHVWKMVRSGDPEQLAQMADMIDHCPSGALTRRAQSEAADDEPQLAPRVLVIDDGPLHVAGGIEVARADGETIESRNRMTLCRCGASAIKPLCDGSHANVEFTDS